MDSPSHSVPSPALLYKYTLALVYPAPSHPLRKPPPLGITIRPAMKKVRSRARRIPAFGEWNYDHGNGDWPVTQYFDAAMQAGVVVATLPSSPKPVKKAVKWSDSATLEVELEKQQHKAVASFGDPGAKKQGKQSRVADAGAHASANYKACRVARAVDEDLYEIPPDLLCHKPRKRLTRSMWTCCLGLSCIA